MTAVYDAGVFIAAERNDRLIWADHRARLEVGLAPVTTAPVVAQVSRSAEQVQLRRFLRGCSVIGFASDQSHDVGALLASARTSDVVDAHLAVVASQRGSALLTSDPDDLRHLVRHLQKPVKVQLV